MRRSSLIACALLVTTTFGCEQVKRQVAGMRDQIDVARQRIFGKKNSAPPPFHHVQPAHPVAPAPAPATPPRSAAHPAAAAGHGGAVQQVASTSPRRRDEPYVSQDTGTVFPGMSEKDVYSLWGAPAAVRHMGDFTYLYFKNGCEYSCGHLDVVTLQNGQVVDALVRWPGHGYAGPANQPANAEPQAPPSGGNTLQVMPPVDTAPSSPMPAPAATDTGTPAPTAPPPAPQAP